EYLENSLWAESLPNCFQRVLAANLAVLLPTDQVRLSAWLRENVNLEVQVTVEQFDVDTAGNGVLVAWWRIMSPGGGTLLKAGLSRAPPPGPAPGANPQGATATLSSLLADFSHDLAETINAEAKVQSSNPQQRR